MKKLLTILSLFISSYSFSQVVVKVPQQDISGKVNKSDSGIIYVTPNDLGKKVDTSHKNIEIVFAPLYSVKVNDSTNELHAYMTTDTTLGNATDTTVASSLAIRKAIDNRIHNNGWVSVLNYGAKADSSTLSADGINAAITVQYNAGGGTVLIPPGKYLINKAIRIKDNVTLIATGADIYLNSGANDYMVRNDDFYKGNKNISITGGTWHANGAANGILRLNDSTTLDTDYYGFGFVFCRVNNLLVENLEIDNTQTWGIGHFIGNYETFRNIKFHQMLRDSYNGDGISGFGDNCLIENISGYTNDDMVGFIVGTNGGFGNHGFPAGYWPTKQNVYNVAIRNITGELYDSAHKGIDSAYAFRLVRVHSANGDTLFHAQVDGVSGVTRYAPIIIQTTYTGFNPGVIQNVDINNVSAMSVSNKSGANLRSGFIRVDGAKQMRNLNISNVTRYDTIGNYPLIGLINSNIKNLNINNFSNFTTSSQLINDSISVVKNVNISNGINTDTTLTAPVPIYKKWNLTDSLTFLSVVNVKNNITDSAINKNSGAKISLKSIAFPVDTAKLTGKSGDVVYQKAFGLVYYENGKWNSNITGGSVGNADSLGGYPASSYYIKTAVDALLSAKANDNSVVHNTLNENVGGVKTFTSNLIVSDGLGTTTVSGASVIFNRSSAYFSMASAGQVFNIQADEFLIRNRALTVTMADITTSNAIWSVKNRYTANPTMTSADSLTMTDKKYVDSVFANVGASVASASAITPTGNTFHVTGTTTITSITATNVKAGSVITIIFDGSLTFTDGNNLKLAGNFTTSADATITLRYDGTNFYEMSRSIN
ncbi:MAG TPA: glycosyl hydrolase family 28-related protein [Hanamia sp.]|nr:glycosyl hydrolase family 28-related protein [Hanamia sp.]